MKTKVIWHGLKAFKMKSFWIPMALLFVFAVAGWGMFFKSTMEVKGGAAKWETTSFAPARFFNTEPPMRGNLRNQKAPRSESPSTKFSGFAPVPGDINPYTGHPYGKGPMVSPASNSDGQFLRSITNHQVGKNLRK